MQRPHMEPGSRHSNFSLEKAHSAAVAASLSLYVVHCRNSLACSAVVRTRTHTDTHNLPHTQWCLSRHYQRTHWCEANGISLAVSFPKSKAFRSLPFLPFILLFFFRLPHFPPPPPHRPPIPSQSIPLTLSSSSTH